MYGGYGVGYDQRGVVSYVGYIEVCPVRDGSSIPDILISSEGGARSVSGVE